MTQRMSIDGYVIENGTLTIRSTGDKNWQGIVSKEGGVPVEESYLLYVRDDTTYNQRIGTFSIVGYPKKGLRVDRWYWTVDERLPRIWMDCGTEWPNTEGATQVTYTVGDRTDTNSSGYYYYCCLVKFVYFNYNLTYDANGGTGGASGTTTHKYTDTVTIGNAPTRSNFIFAGWRSGNSSAKPLLLPGQEATGADLSALDDVHVDGATTTLVAQWVTKLDYTITFDKKGGTGGANSLTVQYGQYIPATVSCPSKPGYKFLGYFRSETGGDKIYDENGYIVTPTAWYETEDTTLYAQWEGVSYKVSFDANGQGTPSPTTKDVNYGSPYGELAEISAEGYTFNGWYTAPTGGTLITAETIVTATSDHTLYAHWTAHTYSIHFDGNGATSGLMADQSMTYGTEATLSMNQFTREGCTFQGWASVAKSLKEYDDGQTVSNLTTEQGGMVTLYAVWYPYCCYLNTKSSFNGNAVAFCETDTGRFETIITEFNDSSQFIGSKITPQRIALISTVAGKMCSWTSKTGEVTVSNNIATVTNEKTANPNSISSTTAGSKLTVANEHGTHIGTPVVSAGRFGSARAVAVKHTSSDVGYIFTGWTITLPGTAGSTNGEVLNNSEDYTKSGNTYTFSKDISVIVKLGSTTNATTITANYEQVATYNVTLNPRGGQFQDGTSAEKTISVEMSGTLNNDISAYLPTKSGYSFTGWWSAATGGTQIWDANGLAVSGEYWNGSGTTATWKYDGAVTVHAQWQAKSFVVTLEQQPGSGGTETVSATFGQPMPSGATKPTLQWYDFMGYYTQPNGGGTQYYTASMTSARNWDIAENTILYASWKGNEFTVTFDANGHGTPSKPTQIVNYGSTYGELATISAEGYTFDGWYTERSGGTKITAASTVAITSNQTLYAHWIANKVTVSFDENGHGSKPANKEVTFGSTYGTLPIISAEGWTFGEWWTAASGGSHITEYTTVTNANAHTLYAHWTANDYTIQFNANGGSGTMADLPMKYGIEKQLTANTYSRTGYTFMGWATSPIGAKVYNDEDRVNNLTTQAEGVVVLYAVWNGNAYSQTFNINGGKFGDGTTTDKSLTTIYGKSNYYGIQGGLGGKPIRTGYTFSGWFDDPSSGNKAWDADGLAVSGIYWDGSGSNANWKYDGEKTFYAQWTANQYDCTLNANQGVFSGGGTTKSLTNPRITYDTSNWASLGVSNTPARDGYAFQGFTDSIDGGNTVWNSSGNAVEGLYWEGSGATAIWKKLNGLTAYASWTANAYTIKFNANGGAGTMADLPMVYDTAKNLIANAFTRIGYTFAGWALSSTGTKVYNDQQLVSNLTKNAGETINLYAVWTANAYSIKFNANGGSGAMDNLTMVYGTAKNLTANAFTRTGYTFSGWANSPSGSVVYIDQQSVNNLTETAGETINLYAVWTANTYTIKFNANGGSGTMADLPMVYDTAKNLIANAFTRIGYTFAGWALSSTGTKVYDDLQSVNNLTSTNGGTVNLYAVWSAKIYTGTLKSTIGNFPDGTTEKTLPSPYLIYSSKNYNKLDSAYIPSYSGNGYVFQGFYDAETGGKQIWSAAGNAVNGDYWNGNGTTATWKYDDNITAYAQWSAVTSTITFNQQSGSGGTTSATATYGSAMPQATMPTRTGYIFGGYWTEIGGQGTQYYNADGSSTRNWDKATNTTLYAQWTAKQYSNSKLDPNGGQFTDGTTTQKTLQPPLEFGASTNYNISSYSVSKQGYNFGGWWTKNGTEFGEQVWDLDYNATQGTYWTDNGSLARWQNDGDVNVYAKWNAASYTVKFNPNLGSGTTKNQTIECGVATALARNTYTRNGYKFSGWNTKSDYTGDSYTDGQVITDITTQGNIINLYAVWTPIKYTIRFNGNGASGGTMSDMPNCEFGKQYTLTTNSFTKTGYKFSGWDTNSPGAVVVFNDGGTVTNLTNIDNGTVTLYAVWTPISYSIVFDKNATDATGVMSTLSMTYGIAKELTNIGYSRLGYSFKEWNTEPSGSGTAYQNLESVINLTTQDNGTVTLYAQWVAGGSAVDLYKNDGTQTIIETISPKYGNAMPTLTQTPQRDGYVFQGYYDTEAQSGGNKYYNANLTSARAWDKTETTYRLYARWTAKTTTVTLSMNGGSGGSTSVVATYGSDMPTINLPTLANYNFLGYYDSDGKQYYTPTGTSASKWDKTNATYELTARWEGKPCVISFWKNNGSTETTPFETLNVKYGEDLTQITLTKTPTKAEFSFQGYFDSATQNNGTRYFDANLRGIGTWNKSGATADLYAWWSELDKYTIVLNANGGRGGTQSVDVAQGYELPMEGVVMPTRSGYKFKGFFENPTAPYGAQYYDENGSSVGQTKWTQQIGGTIYAQWEALTYDITLNDAGGAGGQGTVTATYDQMMPRLSQLPSLSPKLFNGYFDALEDGMRYYNADGSGSRKFTSPNISILYAQYISPEYVVSFDKQGGTGGDDSASVTYQEDMPTITPPIKEGYVFVGYFESPNGEGTQYYNADGTSHSKWDKTEAQTLYAFWVEDEYIITLSQNGGTGGQTSVVVGYHTPMPTLTSLPTREGFTFKGYFDKSTGGTQYYTTAGTSASVWDKTYATMLYAQWIGDEYTVSLYDGKTPPTKVGDVTATFGEMMPNVEIPVWVGHSFLGYYDNNNVIYYTPAGLGARNWDKNEDTSLIAHWSVKSFVLPFKFNNTQNFARADEYPVTEVECQWGEPYPDVFTTPLENPGYTLDGIWLRNKSLNTMVAKCYDSNAKSIATVNQPILQNNAANCELVAVWILSDIYDLTGLRKAVGIIPIPFANDASSRIILPNSAQNGSLSYDGGFDAKFARPVSDNPIGRVITRQMLNTVGNIGSQCQFFEQCGGYYTFDPAFCAAVNGYPKDAILKFFNEEENTLRTVKSLMDNNSWNFLTNGVDGIHWMYVDDNPEIGFTVDYSSGVDISNSIFIESGIPDLYEVQYDSYLQMFALSYVVSRSLRRDSMEDWGIENFIDQYDPTKPSQEQNEYYLKVNGMFATYSEGISHLDIYGEQTDSFISIPIGGFCPYEWVHLQSAGGLSGYTSRKHSEKISPISPLSCGVMLSKGDKIRVRNVLIDRVVPGLEFYAKTVKEKMYNDREFTKSYLVKFASLYRRETTV